MEAPFYRLKVLGQNAKLMFVACSSVTYIADGLYAAPFDTAYKEKFKGAM